MSTTQHERGDYSHAGTVTSSHVCEVIHLHKSFSLKKEEEVIPLRKVRSLYLERWQLAALRAASTKFLTKSMECLSVHLIIFAFANTFGPTPVVDVLSQPYSVVCSHTRNNTQALHLGMSLARDRASPEDQFKMASTCSGQPIHPPSRISEFPLALP